MKLWIGQGSEHSYSLVLIGHFVDETKARGVEEKFERLKVGAESELPELTWEGDQRYTDELYELLKEVKLYELSRSDVENFAYEHTVKRRGKDIQITTDEGEIQGFLKVLLNAGARIEVYSAHDWTPEGQPRQEAPDEGSGPDAEN
jgi:Family of unknown function (DUF6375)